MYYQLLLKMCCLTARLSFILFQFPRFPVFVMKQFIGCLAIGDPFVYRIPDNPLFYFQRDICQQGKWGRAITLFDRRYRCISSLYAVDEIGYMIVCPVFFGHIEFFFLECLFPVGKLSRCSRIVSVPVVAYIQTSLCADNLDIAIFQPGYAGCFANPEVK